MYAVFWLIPRRLNFICLRFGTLFHLAHEYGTVCSETSVCKIKAPGKYLEESIQHSEHAERVKSEVEVPHGRQRQIPLSVNFCTSCGIRSTYMDLTYVLKFRLSRVQVQSLLHKRETHTVTLCHLYPLLRACGSVVVKALRY